MKSEKPQGGAPQKDAGNVPRGWAKLFLICRQLRVVGLVAWVQGVGRAGCAGSGKPAQLLTLSVWPQLG